MRFTKMQGAGNDYVFIDARSIEADWASLSEADERSALRRRWGRHHTHSRL